MVQAIATQTFKGVDAGARDDFEQRLLTLSNVNSLLTDESWESAELHAVIRASLRPISAARASGSLSKDQISDCGRRAPWRCRWPCTSLPPMR